ncbi:Ribonuclease H-like superfamily protein [Rhynchospora pubera]|uniref:Ribonuclease H-like superfamily protein n=1 Tax=Rhynchospora pubera TaxID=906938 RepID=A0AAV8FUS0_9POAL|nr:Ribonuclease H-like superfamily protein [Rhynchospora pubera]
MGTPKLIELLGFHGALFISLTFPDGPSSSSHPDRLILTCTKNGKFSLKATYRMSQNFRGVNRPLPQHMEALYNRIWHSSGIIPKARLFLWKAVRHALPTDYTIATRIGLQLQGCSICGHRREDDTHVLFKCPKARQTWLSSSLGLRTENLPDEVPAILATISPNLSEELFSVMAMVSWSYWKLRCKQIFEGKDFGAAQVLKLAEGYARNMRQANLIYAVPRMVPRATSERPPASFYCFSDGSWVDDNQDGSGWAYVIFDDNQVLCQFGMQYGRSSSPFHSELLGLYCAFQTVKSLGIDSCCFLTDCQHLYRVMSGLEMIDSVHWGAFYEAIDLKCLFDASEGFYCKHVGRVNNCLADSLANYARLRKVVSTGYTFPTVPHL